MSYVSFGTFTQTKDIVITKADKDFVITKADKGNKVVVLNAVDYEQKLNELISDNSTYEICNNNPLKYGSRVIIEI